MLPPRVFVVMPFDAKEVTLATAGLPAKKVDFDLVYQRLFAPALRQAGCEAFRADQEPGAGDIRTDMYFELVTADAVLADISILNANVFYELGIRHGVAPRGVFMVHGGWSRRPFDVAPDRTFGYAGELFETGVARDVAWEQRLAEQVARLAQAIRAAMLVDDRTIGSPVYKEIPNLKPVDWHQVETARFKYFQGVLDDWKARVRVARAKGYAGDILSLAADAPTRYHHAKLLFEAARALIDLKRYEAARDVLEEARNADPHNLDADCQYGLVLGRLGKIAEAEEHLKAVTQAHAGEPEAQGVLGRVYKDRWRLQWEDEKDLVGRQRQAIAHSPLAAQAIRCYAAVSRRRLDSYYTGINVVGVAKLLDHLGKVTGEAPAAHDVEDLATYAVVVRFAAAEALKRAKREGDGCEEVWSGATLGELALIEGDAALAARLYRDAANAADTTWFQADSMLQQIELYQALDFQPAATRAVAEELRRVLARLERPQVEYGKVVIASGHMIDAPNRPQPRFPPHKESLVRERLDAILQEWEVGPGDLAICGGARGSDILFAELCHARGAKLWICLPLPEAEFLVRSVRLPSGNWEQRFFDLCETSDVCLQQERLGSLPVGADVFERNNVWILNLARAHRKGRNVYAVLVWDEQPAGDGPGGTSHFAQQVRRLEGRLRIVNPTQL